MRSVLIVLRKELRENLRDRRTLVSALLFGTVLMPLLVAVLVNLTVHRTQEQDNKSVTLAVVHGERAPNLLAYLRQYRIDVLASDLDDAAARAAVHRQRFHMVLWIPDNYASQLSAGMPAPILLYSDSSDAAAGNDLGRVRAVLGQYGFGIARLRLMARGVDPTVLSAIAVQDIDVATPTSRSVLILGTLTAIILMTMLMGGLHIVLDATAGERERGSLEPLLTTPVRREQLIYGKILAACVFMLISLSLSVCVMALALRHAGLDRLGMNQNMSVATVLKMIASCAPLAPLGASLMTIVAAFTRSYREAQTYVGLILALPTFPLIFAGALGLQPTAWLMMVPALSQHFMLMGLLRAEPVAAWYVALSVSVTLLLGVLAALAAGRLYHREKLLG
ncbi:MAG TPA: ABC transporter permease [Steroidobacteraceae bacterium]|jgi:sodium transport system permease protein|nr:ABC transporter permease [Steroidobacteraceae bacterium]